LIVSKFGFVNGSCISFIHKFAQGFLFPSVMEHQEPFYIELLKYWTKIHEIVFRNQKTQLIIVKENKEGP
jgi:hypothetical protein